LPRVRIEWVPVQLFGLGRLGFDHLHLVLEPGDAGSPQDDWFVMEGVREATDAGTFLGIEGADGRTTLAIANLAGREALLGKIGTPEQRGSRALPYAGEDFRAWETMASYARDIEAEDYPYIAYGLPGSPTPTINSSSAIASLLHYSGLDPRQQLPHGVHLSPGMSTLLGTGADERLRIEHGFTTILGGGGHDYFEGTAAGQQIEKFYGGEGDDMFRWSPGFNIVHGGQPQLGYAADGTDVIDYSGAGNVTITFNRHFIPHKSPSFVAVFEAGTDHLFSIERIQWNARTDRIEVGKGIDLLEDDRVLQPHASHADAELRTATLVPADGGGARLVGTDRSETIVAGSGDDTLHGGAGGDVLVGGPGSDGYVYLPGDGHDLIIDLASGADVDELVLGGGIAPADVGVFRSGAEDLMLTLGDGGSILVVGFFAGAGAGIERVTFDHAPAWTRADIDLLAIDALHPKALLLGDLDLAAWAPPMPDAPPEVQPAPLVEPYPLGLF
jgi:Ca2+-binding RTX toxin-like protein